jgi:hypothetical protein
MGPSRNDFTLHHLASIKGSRAQVKTSSGKDLGASCVECCYLFVSFPNQWEGRPTTTRSSIHLMLGELDPFPCIYLSVQMSYCQSPIVHFSLTLSVQIKSRKTLC